MKYVRLDNNIAVEIIPGEDTRFPGIPITDRYSEEFLAKCVEVDDSVEVSVGWIYDSATGTFAAPEDYGPTEPETPPTVIESDTTEIDTILDIIEGRVD